VESSRECGNEPSGSIKCWETIKCPNNWQPLEYCCSIELVIIFWGHDTCISVEVYRGYRRTYCLHLHGQSAIPASSLQKAVFCRAVNACIANMPLLLAVSLALLAARMPGRDLNRMPSLLQDIPKIVGSAEEARQQALGAFPVRLACESP
jgi:hypothetical protein